MFCLVGQVLVDVTLASGNDENKLRLGGVMHAARAMWALGLNYTLAYAAPAYLVRQIEDFVSQHGGSSCVRIADVTGSPNVILIPEPTEARAQGYELLLRDIQDVHSLSDQIANLAANTQITDVLVFPGGFSLQAVLHAFSKSSARMYIDAAYDVSDFSEGKELGREFEVFFMSTSSDLFLNRCNSNPATLAEIVLNGVGKTLVFKENRGGSRLYTSANKPIEMGAQVRPIQHSVGVGDCFDVVFTTLRQKYSDQIALAYASFIAAEYASTTFPDDFKLAVTRTLKIKPEVIVDLDGVRVPWEAREKMEIYIAAPDFDYMNKGAIDAASDALKYHNFCPRRPVIEHGQVKENDEHVRRMQIFHQDMQLLNRCAILFAVLLNDDPGTLIEIGIAKEKGKPVIVYDPYRIAKNLVLQQLPDVLTNSLDGAISGVFQYASKLLQGNP